MHQVAVWASNTKKEGFHTIPERMGIPLLSNGNSISF